MMQNRMLDKWATISLAGIVFFANPTFAQERKEDTKSLVSVEATGYGESIKEATEDAKRKAVEQVVGDLVDSETLALNGDIVKDEILSYSGGFVESFETIGKPIKEDEVWEVTIRANIRKTKLARTLHGKLTDRVSIKGGLKRPSKAQATEKTDSLAKSFADFPAAILRTEVCRDEDGEPMFRTDERGIVSAKIRLSVDSDAYRKWTADLMKRLEELAGAPKNDRISARMTDVATDPNMAGLQQQMKNLAQQYPGMMAQVDPMGMAMASKAFEAQPSLALSAPSAWKSGTFSVGVILPGQEKVWQSPNGNELPLRMKTYSFSGAEAKSVRAAFDKAMCRKSGKNGAPPALGIGETRDNVPAGAIQLYVFVMEDDSELAKIRVVPTITDNNPWNGGDGRPKVFSTSLVAPKINAGLFVTPFVVQDASHCFATSEQWVVLGMFDDEDLDAVTDVRVEYAAQ